MLDRMWDLIERAPREPDAVDDLCQSRAQTARLCMAILEMRDALDEIQCGIDAHDARELARETLENIDAEVQS